MASKIPDKLYEAGFFASYFTNTLQIGGPFVAMEHLCYFGERATIEEAKRKIRETIDRLEVAHNVLSLPYPTAKRDEK